MKGKRVNINSYVTILEPYLKIGLTLHEACKQSRIPYTTVIKYKKDNEDVCRQLDALEDYAVVIAKMTLMKGIKEDPNLALKYLERVRRNEFSLKTEQDSKYQIEIKPIISLELAEKGIPPILGGLSKTIEAGKIPSENEVKEVATTTIDDLDKLEEKPQVFKDNSAFKDYNNIITFTKKSDDTIN